MTDKEVKYKVMSHYSSSGVPECKGCGYNDIQALCLDHVNSDGAKHRKSGGKKGVALYKQLLRHNFQSDYEFQVLCCNCNMIKFFKSKECSHSKSKEWKNKISKANKMHVKPTGKYSYRARKVSQFDLNQNLLKVWNTIKEAESFYNSNPKAKNIVAVCNKRQKTAYGFVWKHYNN